ncbi:MAG: hypothetical protein ACYCQI_14730 [Gammaproteobacteria bacterium]
MYKYFLTIILILMFCQSSFAVDKGVDLNKEFIQVKHQIDDIRLSLTTINLKLTDLDRETIRMRNNELHSVDSSDFLIINKIILYVLLASCVGAGAVIRQMFFGYSKKS